MHRNTRIIGAALAAGIASLSLTGVAQAQPVHSLTGDWSASNSTVQQDAGAVCISAPTPTVALCGGSLLYNGCQRQAAVSDVDNFTFDLQLPARLANTTGAGSATAASGLD